MKGAIAKAQELPPRRRTAHPQPVHQQGIRCAPRRRGPEIWEDTDAVRSISFVAGVGTGGTLSGVGEYLKSRNPNVKQSSRSSLQALRCSRRGTPGPHKIQGIGAGFVPDTLEHRGYMTRPSRSRTRTLPPAAHLPDARGCLSAYPRARRSLPRRSLQSARRTRARSSCPAPGHRREISLP